MLSLIAALKSNDFQRIPKLVGGLEHFLCSHILGIVIPIDFHIFQRGGPTTNAFQSQCFIQRHPKSKGSLGVLPSRLPQGLHSRCPMAAYHGYGRWFARKSSGRPFGHHIWMGKSRNTWILFFPFMLVQSGFWLLTTQLLLLRSMFSFVKENLCHWSQIPMVLAWKSHVCGRDEPPNLVGYRKFGWFYH